ncbi:MAG: hypothetical protein JO309_07545 [Pseudonocardiales bacterium]|nr:hypothetical protein [Pseudonocardiales bacterium]MBV9729242.1 hypothetical protein [Pseudonocardiales bacterium]
MTKVYPAAARGPALARQVAAEVAELAGFSESYTGGVDHRSGVARQVLLVSTAR